MFTPTLGHRLVFAWFLGPTVRPIWPIFNNTKPFNRRCRIYSGFYFLLAHYVPPFEHVKDKM